MGEVLSSPGDQRFGRASQLRKLPSGAPVRGPQTHFAELIVSSTFTILLYDRSNRPNVYRGKMILIPRLCHWFWGIFPLPLWTRRCYYKDRLKVGNRPYVYHNTVLQTQRRNALCGGTIQKKHYGKIRRGIELTWARALIKPEGMNGNLRTRKPCYRIKDHAMPL